MLVMGVSLALLPQVLGYSALPGPTSSLAGCVGGAVGGHSPLPFCTPVLYSSLAPPPVSLQLNSFGYLFLNV